MQGVNAECYVLSAFERRKTIINVGIIGCGYWGPNLIRNFNWLPNSNMLVCCDKVVKRLERMKRLYPAVETTSQAEELFKDSRLDAVGIANPRIYPL